MTVFMIIVGLLLLTALILIVPPLIGRGRYGSSGVDHREVNLSVFRAAMKELERDLEAGTIAAEPFQQSRAELERRILEEVGPQALEVAVPVSEASSKVGHRYLSAGLTTVLVAVFAIGLYLYLGTPAAINPQQAAMQQASTGTPEGMSAKIKAMVSGLAERLKEHPDDATGWAMLGRSYIVLERFSDARAALEKAAQLKPDDPQLLADLADSLAMTRGESLQGRPNELISQALALDPNNQKALWLAGTAAYETSNYPDALKYWKKLYLMLPEGSASARTMQGNIAEAQALLEGGDPAQIMSQLTPDTGVAATSTVATTARVTGRVSIAAVLRGQVKDDDTVFIFAKAIQGPPMPLAVQRVKVRDLPMDFELNDSMAMSPQMRLSRFSQVKILARVSRSGNAMPKRGDLQGSSAAVAVGSQIPELVIDEVIP